MYQRNRRNAFRSARATVVLTIALTIAACGDPTRGDDFDIDITGGWLYDNLLVGQGWQCIFSLVNLQLAQSGATVTGTYTDNGFACLGPSGASVFGSLGSGQITNGRINGTSVSFGFSNTNWQHAGTIVVGVSGQAAMTGSVAGTMNLGAPWGSITFTGNTWNAAR